MPRGRVFTSSLPILWILFICLIVVLRISSTILNRKGNSKHSCLVPSLKGKELSFSIKYDVSYRFYKDAHHKINEVPCLVC